MKQALRTAPSVLFLDNFEDNQNEDGNLKNPALRETLLELALLGGETFRLLFTSRHRVRLGPGPLKVRPIDLGGLSPSGCRKLRQLPRFEELGKLSEETWQRALFHFGGHPKALELLEGFLREQPDQARRLLADMGSAVAAVDEDLKAEQQEKGRKLLVANVLATVPPECRPAFDRLCLLEAPLPAEELETLLAAEGIAQPAADLGWLRDHGFLARTVAPSALTGGDAIHRLLASRQQEVLAEREGPDAVRAWHLRVAAHLVEGPGPLSDLGIAARHRDLAGDRAGALEMHSQWAIALRDRHAYSACLQIAKEGLSRFQIRDDEAEKTAAAHIWLIAHDALTLLGDIAQARVALEAVLKLVEQAESEGARFSLAGARLRLGRALARTGDTAQALSQLEAAINDFEKGNYTLDRAIALGDVARLRVQTGDVAGALKLFEEKLAIVGELGDVRSRVVTLGDVARLRVQAGDVAGALKLYEEMLAIFEQLGDVRSRAVTLGDVARLRAQAGDMAGALKLCEENLMTYEQLGDVRSRAVALGDVALLCAQAGKVAGAVKLLQEKLQICRQLRDTEEIANAQYGLAAFDLEQGNRDQALERLAESWQLVNQIGHAQAIAVVGQLYGQLLTATDPSRALEILQTSRNAFQLLGMTDQVNKMDELIQRLEQPADS